VEHPAAEGQQAFAEHLAAAVGVLQAFVGPVAEVLQALEPLLVEVHLV
jgi:hypothetical protein